jgi:hypothetical protein
MRQAAGSLPAAWRATFRPVGAIQVTATSPALPTATSTPQARSSVRRVVGPKVSAAAGAEDPIAMIAAPRAKVIRTGT